MLDMFHWVLNRRERTKDTARRRLQTALMNDRVDLSPQVMETMKREIRAVVSRYLVVGDDFLEFEIRRTRHSVVLVSNIQVKDPNRLAPAH